jgi:rhamnulokinase
MSPTTTARLVAIDLGASTGRVIAAEVGPETLALTETHRFPTGASANPAADAGYLTWDAPAIFAGIAQGLKAAAAAGRVDAIGVDTWGVDYALLDAQGEAIGPPVCYRDDRTQGVESEVRDAIGRERLYELTGIAHQRFNTIYQLAAERRGLAPGGARLAQAAKLVMMPDMITHWLTGVASAEVTQASTSALLDPTTRTWSRELLDALGLDRGLFPEPLEPGTVIGGVREAVAERTGLPAGVPVIAVGSHDTASAVAAVPATGGDFAYISCGTWSLVGVELGSPVTTEAARTAGFTNELGVDGTVRFLRNVMGMWLLQECQRTWREEGAGQADGAGRQPLDVGSLLAAAAAEPPGGTVDADDPSFLAPGSMPSRIAAAVAARGGTVPRTPAQMTRCIVDSLAAAHADAIVQARRVTGARVEAVHIVGGGSQGQLLCQATADATGLPVLAGPTEAAAIGNALVQARAIGALHGTLANLRTLVRHCHPPVHYAPSPLAA